MVAIASSKCARVSGEQGPDLDDAGDVDGDLDRSELVLHPRQLLLDEVGVADVTDHRAGVDPLVAQGDHGAVELLGVPRPARAGSRAAQLAGDEQAEAAGASGDEGDGSGGGHAGELPAPRRATHTGSLRVEPRTVSILLPRDTDPTSRKPPSAPAFPVSCDEAG